MSQSARRVAIRVDASEKIGTGHFMRCLALADGLRARGARVRFLSRCVPDHLRKLAVSGGHEQILIDSRPEPDAAGGPAHSRWLDTSQGADARDTERALSGETWEWLVVDHYSLDARWESALRGIVQHVLAIDDLADRSHDCDFLLDQNLYMDGESRYAGKVPAGCRLLLGPRYALLREEFARLRTGVGPRSGHVRRVLVFFGGVDAGLHTVHAVEALAALGRRDLQVDVVVGAEHAQRQEIEARCAALSFTCHVQTRQMADLMAAADLALGAGGSASWERCCVGLPALVVPVAENQKRLVEDAAVAGLHFAPELKQGISLADHLRGLLDNPLLLRAMSYNGMQAVDGRGTRRVLRAMGFGGVDVRKAVASDSSKVFAWRNDPAIRAVSRSIEPMERSTHEDWFAAALADPNRLLLIGERDGTDLGVVRFDVGEHAAEISIYLAPERSSGVGVELLLAAEAWLAESRPNVAAVEAEVLRDNRRSHGLFLAGGYRLESSRYVKRFR